MCSHILVYIYIVHTQANHGRVFSGLIACREGSSVSGA
jgi:hypothetical protein